MIKENKEKSKIRINDAIEFLETAKECLSKKRYKVSIMNAGDAVIAANDAFTISIIQELSTRDHNEAVTLHKRAGNIIHQNKRDILTFILEKRHKLGYRSVEVSKSAAEEVLRKSIKFVKWVQEIVR